MPDVTSPLAAALERLGSAVDLMDAAALRRLSNERADQARATELELMRGDRAKLAELLDQALSRGRALEAAQHEATVRVERAMTLVRGALSGQEP
jgi:Domain of unknown function (DUF4164)